MMIGCVVCVGVHNIPTNSSNIHIWLASAFIMARSICNLVLFWIFFFGKLGLKGHKTACAVEGCAAWDGRQTGRSNEFLPNKAEMESIYRAIMSAAIYRTAGNRLSDIHARRARRFIDLCIGSCLSRSIACHTQSTTTVSCFVRFDVAVYCLLLTVTGGVSRQQMIFTLFFHSHYLPSASFMLHRVYVCLCGGI